MACVSFVADVQQKVLSRWINWRLRTVVVQHPDNLVDQLRDGNVFSTLLTTVTQGDFQPVSSRMQLRLVFIYLHILYVYVFFILYSYFWRRGLLIARWSRLSINEVFYSGLSYWMRDHTTLVS